MLQRWNPSWKQWILSQKGDVLGVVALASCALFEVLSDWLTYGCLMVVVLLLVEKTLDAKI
jgi:hypothetical protein